MCIYVYICVCICMCICVCVCMCTHTCMCMYELLSEFYTLIVYVFNYVKYLYNESYVISSSEEEPRY